MMMTALRDSDANRFDTPCSSFSSDTSCARISPPTSTTGLRRSTLDLSQLGSNGVPSRHKLRQNVPSSLIPTESSVSQSPPQLRTESSLSKPRKQCNHSYQESVLSGIDENFQRFFDSVTRCIGDILMFLLTAIFTSKAIETLGTIEIYPSTSENYCQGSQPELEGSESDEHQLSQTIITETSSSNLKDEWGHFAHFQEEFADEFTSISWRASMSSQMLGTLDESEEEENGEFF